MHFMHSFKGSQGDNANLDATSERVIDTRIKPFLKNKLISGNSTVKRLHLQTVQKQINKSLLVEILVIPLLHDFFLLDSCVIR